MKLNALLLLSALAVLTACTEPNKPAPLTKAAEQTAIPDEKADSDLFKGNIVTTMDKAVLCILQDRAGNYWFGTQNSGAYRYDGKKLIVLTIKDGLFQNQIQTIQEDASGNIWFGTGGYGVNRFDGKKITMHTDQENMQSNNSPEKKWEIKPNDLWFYAGGGVYHRQDSLLTYLSFPKPDFVPKYSPNPANKGSAYAVYTTLKDSNGNLWMGTQTMGVCRYDGKSFTWFTEKGLRGPAVLDIFEDKLGRLWFGNNGSGLFCYDGKKLTNITEEKGLSNPDFVKSGKESPGTLARVWAINEDNNGNIWIGTGDSGLWTYDGKNLINYTEKDGLPNHPIETIYKDKGGQLWFGTNGGGVYQLNGMTFEKWIF